MLSLFRSGQVLGVWMGKVSGEVGSGQLGGAGMEPIGSNRSFYVGLSLLGKGLVE